MIGIFNRSHYEDVLVVRVRALVPEKVWRPRYEQINQFERMLTNHEVKSAEMTDGEDRVKGTLSNGKSYEVDYVSEYSDELTAKILAADCPSKITSIGMLWPVVKLNAGLAKPSSQELAEFCPITRMMPLA